MLNSRSIATKTVTALVTVAVLVSVVTIGGVAQTDSENNASSSGDAEPNDELANATPLAYNETVNGTLSSSSDIDYYAVNATAGDGLISRLALKNMFNESVIAVDIVNSNGEVSTELISDMIRGPNHLAGQARPPLGDYPRETATAADTMESSGMYYIRVQESESAETTGNVTYRYNLSVTTENLDQYDPDEEAANASGLDLRTEVNATITGYDDDVYAVDLTAGQNYTVNFSAPNATSYEEKNLPLSLLMYANASAIDESDFEQSEDVLAGDGGFFSQQSVTFTADKNGTHYIKLTPHGTSYNLLAMTNYTLSVTDELPADGDYDGDSITNAEERDLGTDSQSVDSDDDGLTDDCELKYEMDPLEPDSDNDGTEDGQEV